MKFKCAKCNCKEYNKRNIWGYTQFRSYPYHFVSCKKCGYTEVYEDLEGGFINKIKNKFWKK